MELLDKFQTEWKENFPDDALPDIIPRDQQICTSVLLDVINKSEKEIQDLEKRIKQLKLLREFLKAFVGKIQQNPSEPDTNNSDDSSSFIETELKKLASETRTILRPVYTDDSTFVVQQNISEPDTNNSDDSSSFIETELKKLASETITISRHVYTDDSDLETKPSDVLSSFKPIRRSNSMDYHLTKRTLLTPESENKQLDGSPCEESVVSDKKSPTSPLTHSLSTFIPTTNSNAIVRRQPAKRAPKLSRDRLVLTCKLPCSQDLNVHNLSRNANHTSSLTSENLFSSSFKPVKRAKPPSLPPKPKKHSILRTNPGSSAAPKNNTSCNSSTYSCSSSSCNSSTINTNQSDGCSETEKTTDNATGQSSATINSVNASTSPVGGDSDTRSERLTYVTNNQVNSVGQQQQPLSAGLNTKTSLQSSQANTARNCSCQGSSSFTSNEEEIIVAEYRSHSSRASLSGSDPTKDLLKPSADKDKEKPTFSEKQQESDDHFEKAQPHECKQVCVADSEQTSPLSGVEKQEKAESPENSPVVGVEAAGGGESGGLEIEVEYNKTEAEVVSSENDNINDQQNGHEESKIATETSNINSSNMLGSKKHKEIHIVSYRKLDGDFIDTPLHSSSTLAHPGRRSQVSDDVMTRSTGAIEDFKPLWPSDRVQDRKRISSPFDFRYNKLEDKSKSHECDISLTEKPEGINIIDNKSHGLANGKQIEDSILKEQEIKDERKTRIDDQSTNFMQQSIDMRRSIAEFTDVDSDSSDIKVGKNSSQQSLISQPVDTDNCTDDENFLPEEDSLPEYEESIDDAHLLKKRERAIRGFLVQEETFIGYLQNLKKLMDQFTASVNSKESLLTQQEISGIFSNIQTILKLHQECVQQLTPKLQNWSHSETVGPPLKELLLHFRDFQDYSNNYPNACDTVTRCAQVNSHFKKISEEALLIPDKEKINLITLLQKPIGQLQQNAIFIQELLELTPKSHPDHEILSGTWRITQHNLNEASTNGDQIENDHYLLKAEYLVEQLSNTTRKLRCFFLFSDVIVCTKQKFYQKDSFDVKWFIPIHQLELHSNTDHGDINYKFTETIDELKKRMSSIETELRNRKLKMSARVSDRATEKLTKKLIEHQREIARLSGNLEFRLKHGKKVYTLLMSTNYSREEWKEAIISLKDKSFQETNYTPSDIQQIVTNCKKLSNIINTVSSQKEEHLFGGSLSVTLHELTGLDEVCGTYCCLELDSCGQFFTKARSAIRESTNLVWNEEFELELDYSQTLRILCFKRNTDDGGDILLGKSALALSKDWLSNFTRKTISMNKISLVISVCHIPPNKMIQRIPSKVKTGVFGVDVQKVALHQGKAIPDIIPICTREIEKRGLDEVGIYRVSGGLTEVKQLKCAFEKNTMKARRMVEDADCSVHTIAAVLKLYFRELPEPLFTNLLYDKFLNISDIKDPEQKEKELISLIHSLPEVNYNILLHILDHLKCIHEHSTENKMTNGNLAVIFGQSLMQPAPTPEPVPAMEPGSAQEALAYMNALQQNNILKYLLDLKCSGKNILKP